MKMNKLQEIQMKRNIGGMKNAAEQSNRALDVLIRTMEASDQFNGDDVKTVQTIKRFVKDMDKFLGTIEQQLK